MQLQISVHFMPAKVFLVLLFISNLFGLPSDEVEDVREEGESESDIQDVPEEVHEKILPGPKPQEIINHPKESTNLGHSFSIIRFSYDDKNPLGPKNWKNTSIVKDAMENENDESTIYNRNRCDQQWTTPININTKNVVAPDINTIVEDEENPNNIIHRSVTLTILSPHISSIDWELGHPGDAYHGLQVGTPQLGVLELNDRFDYIGQGVDIGWTGVNEFTNYDFSYAAFFYCDPAKASSERSMHQIDGKKFPLEIDFLFFSQPPKIGMDRFICSDLADPSCTTVAVMLVVLAEFSDKDNPNLAPLITAASKYKGPPFTADDEDEHYTTPIPTPWSPTWLIPESSDYYYYDDGTFPVPPCWPIARIYIAIEHITISHKQLSVLSSIRTEREPTTDHKMVCTFSILQKRTGDDAHDVKYNESPFTISGKDGRPLKQTGKKGQNSPNI